LRLPLFLRSLQCLLLGVRALAFDAGQLGQFARFQQSRLGRFALQRGGSLGLFGGESRCRRFRIACLARFTVSLFARMQCFGMLAFGTRPGFRFGAGSLLGCEFLPGRLQSLCRKLGALALCLHFLLQHR